MNCFTALTTSSFDILSDGYAPMIPVKQSLTTNTSFSRMSTSSWTLDVNGIEGDEVAELLEFSFV